MEEYANLEPATFTVLHHNLEIALAEALTPIDAVALADGEYDITGYCVWLGARLMLQLLEREDIRLLIRGKRVIELGCGTGVCGLGFALAGASQIVLTDGEETVCALARANVSRNAHLLTTVPTVQLLRWGHSLGSNEHYDLVVASDVIYDGELAKPLVQEAARLLGDSVGCFFLAYVPRTFHDASVRQKLEDESAHQGLHFEWRTAEDIFNVAPGAQLVPERLAKAMGVPLGVQSDAKALSNSNDLMMELRRIEAALFFAYRVSCLQLSAHAPDYPSR